MAPAARTILHVDMDAFFAAVEQLRRPELRGTPVVVGGRGDPRQRGVVSTASYEARPYGIRSGMPLRTAYRLCPHAVFLPVDVAAYRAVAARFHAILRETGARVEPLGLDEAFLDCTGLPDAGEVIARRIKERIRRELQLTASVGVGPNKLLAKIASGLHKPDGLTVIDQNDVPARLGPLPVTALPGVGPKTAAALAERFQVRTVADLAALPLGALQDAFGPHHGRSLYEMARGQDESPVVTDWAPRSVSRERTFQVDLRRPETIRRAIAALARQVADDLRTEAYRAATVTLKVRFDTFRTLTRSRTLAAPTDDPAVLGRTALDLLARVTVDRPVRLLGVRAAKLTPSGAAPAGDATAPQQRLPLPPVRSGS
ncbi:MAG: DNA polymerase IV [Armatimonadota bacterium]|nr:DNA polymerase IV [Armatimonadota bacterium]MDR7484951.1 DNA polymerase IV [Armatimonadota bacterium]MDR7533654.1 DNA polymerase IV [Armatimonadota bacterium]MDR7535465.1 DNA polymerase IV [Armatimonadota bacterium]